MDLPFPLGGCFGYWGYDLKNFIEPRLRRRAINDLEFPDCQLGFYDSLVAFDHRLGSTWVLATGLQPDGSRSEKRARQQFGFWLERLVGQGAADSSLARESIRSRPGAFASICPDSKAARSPLRDDAGENRAVFSNLTRAEFLARVGQAQNYIRRGDIYQVNLSQRLAAPFAFTGWQLFHALINFSPAPFSAYLDAGEFQLASSSPELFLRLSGAQIQTRPIKGTRPRSCDATPH